MLFQNCNGGQRLHGRDITGARHHYIGIIAIVGGGPFPNADALRAMRYRVGHSEALQVVLLVRDDYVDVIPRPQAMIRHAEQTVGVGRQINSHHVWTLVGDDIEETWVLMREAVVILPPHQRGDEDMYLWHRG